MSKMYRSGARMSISARSGRKRARKGRVGVRVCPHSAAGTPARSTSSPAKHVPRLCPVKSYTTALHLDFVVA